MTLIYTELQQEQRGNQAVVNWIRPQTYGNQAHQTAPGSAFLLKRSRNKGRDDEPWAELGAGLHLGALLRPWLEIMTCGQEAAGPDANKLPPETCQKRSQVSSGPQKVHRLQTTDFSVCCFVVVIKPLTLFCIISQERHLSLSLILLFLLVKHSHPVPYT